MARPDVIEDAANYEAYLLHFSRPFAHAKHYLGITSNLGKRLKAHGTKEGAKLLYAAHQVGITWQLSQTWPIPAGLSAREYEIKLKKRGGRARLCPICRKGA